ncbi:MAG TPA: MurR/RpiR family transcriptional regulator [Clostridiales bacterium]|nr:MurR/RpiR family transcriptional regulator [Clostridiales bacterium]
MSGCCLRLKELMESLSPKEQQVASFIIEYPNEVISMSIDELASACGTSSSSVVRLCKSAGYSGFKELCRVLSTDLVISQSEAITYNDVRPGDSIESIVHSVCMSNMKSIENTMSLIKVSELEQAVEAIEAAKRIDFYGIGTSGNVAMDAHNKFMRINKISMSSTDPHNQILSASSLQKGDVAVLISYSGDTKDILDTANVVKQTEATLISLTRYSKNPLSERADIRLYSSSSEPLIRSGAMGSRIGQLTVIDILYTAIVSRNYDFVKHYLDRTRLTTSQKHIRSQPL